MIQLTKPDRGVSKSLSVYYCGYEKCENSHDFGPAVRRQYLLHYVIAGKGRYTVGGKTYGVSAGQAFLIKPGELTYYKADDVSPWEYRWVAFDGIDARDIINRIGLSEEYVITTPQPREFESSLIEIMEEFDSGSEFRILSCFYRAMAQLERRAGPSTFEDEYLQKAVYYIQNNYSYRVKISDIARYVGIDRTYLYKIFIKAEKISPKQYLMMVRINAAKNMLRAKSYSVGEIALSCGFIDSPSFCNSFKKVTGVTPRQFVEQVIELE